MRFGEHVLNSLKNKNIERDIPFIALKMVFWAFKTLLSPLGVRKENFFVNCECYDPANSGK
jgi:hypothetical protein